MTTAHASDVLTAVSQVQPGDTIRHRGGEMTVLAVQAYDAPVRLPSVAVLVKTPRGKALCLSFPLLDTVAVVQWSPRVDAA